MGPLGRHVQRRRINEVMGILESREVARNGEEEEEKAVRATLQNRHGPVRWDLMAAVRWRDGEWTNGLLRVGVPRNSAW